MVNGLEKKKAFFAEGIEAILNVNIWAILLFLFLNSSFLNLGILFTITSLISILIIFYLKSYIDSHNKQKTLKIISKMISVNWFLRYLSISFLSFALYFVEVFAKLVGSVFQLSYTSIFYNNAKNECYMTYILFREIFKHLTRIIVILILIVILTIFGESVRLLTILLVVGFFIPLLFSYLGEAKAFK